MDEINVMARMAELPKCARLMMPTMASTEIFTTDGGSVLIGHFSDNGCWAEEVKDMDAVDVTNELDCVACLKELKDNDLFAVSNCGHCMCLECSDEWEQASTKGGGKGAPCPFCREDIETRTICAARKFARGARSEANPVNLSVQSWFPSHRLARTSAPTN